MTESATKQVERLATAIRDMQDQGMKVNKNRLSKYMNEEKGDNISIVTVGKYFDQAMAQCYSVDVKEDNEEVDQELLAAIPKVLACLGIKDSSSAAKDIRNVLLEQFGTLPLTLAIWKRDFEHGKVGRNSHIGSFKELIGRKMELAEVAEVDVNVSGAETLPYDDTPEYWYFALQDEIFNDWWSNCEEEGKDPRQHIKDLFQRAEERHNEADWVEEARTIDIEEELPISLLAKNCYTFSELITTLAQLKEYGFDAENDLQQYPKYPDTPEYWQDALWQVLEQYDPDFDCSIYLECAWGHYEADYYEPFGDTGAPWKVNSDLLSEATQRKLGKFT
jgi:hypothetical protein